MKKLLRFMLMALPAPLLIIAFTLPAFAAVNYGAGSVRGGQTYTLEQMLTSAIEDEYLAGARYKAIIGKFGRQRPFVNIEAAERTHVMALKPLFRKHGVPVPENNAARYVTVPGTLPEAIRDAISAERLTIGMYDIFLRNDLPNDVQLTFTFLRNAAENHVGTFERVLERMEGGARNRNAA